MSVAILTYHACNVLGNHYADNDHVALAEDLVTLAAMGYRVVSLDEAVAAGRAGSEDALAAITFDDGPSLDVEDFEHPDFGPQRSFAGILKDQGGLPASSFVIASPEARDEMDRVDFGGRDWWHDRWWRQGLLTIESHSWDHNHPSLAQTAHKTNQRGAFDTIDTFAECELEVRQASRYIEQRSGRRPRFFAYPWGQASDYLKHEYLPKNGQALGLDAALGTNPGFVDPSCERWYLPRFVCGEHWRSSTEIEKLLQGKP